MLVDLHMHTEYSMDAQSPQSPLAKARAALARGLGIIAITDHLDFYHRHGPAENRDIEVCVRAVRAAKEAFAGRLELLAGIELGQVHADPAADAFLRTHAFDLVIGSLHVMPNDLDIYFHDFASLDCDAFLRGYFAQVLAMERHGGFDVLAHLDYPLRVMRREGYTPSFDQYMDRISGVLRECVSRGYALELNCLDLSFLGTAGRKRSARRTAYCTNTGGWAAGAFPSEATPTSCPTWAAAWRNARRWPNGSGSIP